VAVQLAATQAANRETILRTRGNLLAFTFGALSPGRLVDVSVGIHLVPEGTGTTVLQNPFSNPDEDWFYYASFSLGYEEPVVDVVDVSGITSFREIMDSKAMRIWRPSTEIQAVFTNTTLETAVSVRAVMQGRFLLGD